MRMPKAGRGIFFGSSQFSYIAPQSKKNPPARLWHPHRQEFVFFLVARCRDQFLSPNTHWQACRPGKGRFPKLRFGIALLLAAWAFAIVLVPLASVVLA